MSRQELRKLADFREMAEAHIERLGQAIMARRKALGWSRARLGREVDAHEKTVERWEKAQTAGALDHVEVIARALDMDGDDLLAKAIRQPESQTTTPDVLELLGRLEAGQAALRAELQALREAQKRTAQRPAAKAKKRASG
jgi:ribosome-binding protein aMBF1 (putative translation factor)